MNPKILIIGGDSFIAQAFVKNTSLNKSDIYLISRRKTNYPHETVIENLFNINSDFIKQFNTVINFAAIVHRPNIKNTDLYETINHQLPLHIASMLAKGPATHFIQISSISVYGYATEISYSTTPSPNTIYGMTKLAADNDLINTFTNKIKMSIIRPPMMYGIGKAPGNMMKLIKLINKVPILPLANINNMRHFLNINNFIQYLDQIIINQITGIVLIADKEPISTTSLVKIIATKLNKKIYLFTVNSHIVKTISPNLFYHLFTNSIINTPENTKLFTPINEYSIEQGIDEMIRTIK